MRVIYTNMKILQRLVRALVNSLRLVDMWYRVGHDRAMSGFDDWGKNDAFFAAICAAGIWRVDSSGRIWSERKKRFVYDDKPGSKRYLTVEFKGEDGVVRYTAKHRVVYIALKGLPPPGHTINHIDTRKWNNSPGNLEAVPHIENIAHSHRHGLQPPAKKGEENVNHKLTDQERAEIKAIRLLYPKGTKKVMPGHTLRDLANKYGVSYQLVLRLDHQARGL